MQKEEKYLTFLLNPWCIIKKAPLGNTSDAFNFIGYN